MFGSWNSSQRFRDSTHEHETLALHAVFDTNPQNDADWHLNQDPAHAQPSMPLQVVWLTSVALQTGGVGVGASEKEDAVASAARSRRAARASGASGEGMAAGGQGGSAGPQEARPDAAGFLRASCRGKGPRRRGKPVGDRRLGGPAHTQVLLACELVLPGSPSARLAGVVLLSDRHNRLNEAATLQNTIGG